MNEFERMRRRRILLPFPYYVKINQNFKDYIVGFRGLGNYEEVISAFNGVAGMEVAKGDYIVDVFYAQMFSFGSPTDAINLVSPNEEFVSEIKVSNSIKDVLTTNVIRSYIDFTTSLINIEDINTSDSSGNKVFNIFSKQLTNGTFQQGALEKLTLPKNINNASTVLVMVYCYLDSKDVEIIYPTDTRVMCIFNDYKFEEGNPTNKFILKVPTHLVAPYTSMYSQLEKSGQLYANYQIIGY